jgi:hypothetical protein
LKADAQSRRAPIDVARKRHVTSARHLWRTAMATRKTTAQSKVEKTMKERKQGTLKSGSGKKVTSRKQAIAIGLNEARKKGAKVPKKT